MRVVMTMFVSVVMAVRLRMNRNYRSSDRMWVWMCVFMRVMIFMRMVMIMVVRHRIVMVMAAHTVFNAKFTVFAAVARHQRLGDAAFEVIHTLFQQLKNLALKTKVGR